MEINRLLQAGCTVQYQTGNMQWQFYRHRELAASQQELLYMQSVRMAWQPDTAMIISAPAASSPGQFAFLTLDDADFLFLRTAMDSLRCVAREEGYGVPWTGYGMEILFEERDKGKTFISDIYVCSPADHQGFGLNYLGTSQSLTAALGVTRDRNEVNVSRVIPQLGTLLQFSKLLKPAAHARAVRLILDILHEHPTSALRHLVESYRQDAYHQSTARELYSACQKHLKAYRRMPSDSEDVLLLRPAQVRRLLDVVLL